MTQWALARAIGMSTVGGMFGVVLSVIAVGPAAGGHGTYFPLAVFGAPLSLFVDGWFGFVAVPLVWATIGLGLSVSNRPTIGVLLVIAHLAGIGALVLWGSAWEPGDEQWRYFERANVHVGREIRGACLAYLMGLGVVLGTLVFNWLWRRRAKQVAAA